MNLFVLIMLLDIFYILVMIIAQLLSNFSTCYLL